MLKANRRPVDILSLSLLALMHLACLLVFLVPFSWKLVALAAASYALRMFGVTAGFHRYFSHRTFKTSRVFQFLLGLLGTMAMQNGPLWWGELASPSSQALGYRPRRALAPPRALAFPPRLGSGWQP
jgi:fatty-acid desaturase